MRIVAKFDSLDSTNRYANEELDLSQMKDFDVVWALEQYAGKGQQEKQWESAPGENLTFSIILFPSFLSPSKQFVLTQILSLAVSDYLKFMLPDEEVKIKWPNDVYVNKRKICGMLIHNKIIGEQFYASVGGIGININQKKFPDNIANVISLSTITHKTYDLETELKEVLYRIENRFNKIKGNNIKIYHDEYLKNLLNYKRKANYIYNGQPIRATIQGVNSFGYLELLTDNASQITCDIKGVQFI